MQTSMQGLGCPTGRPLAGPLGACDSHDAADSDCKDSCWEYCDHVAATNMQDLRPTHSPLLRTEEIQVLKDLIAEMEGFKPMASRLYYYIGLQASIQIRYTQSWHDEAASASEALLDETTEQEAVLVPSLIMICICWKSGNHVLYTHHPYTAKVPQSSMTYSDDDAGEADPGSQVCRPLPSQI